MATRYGAIMPINTANQHLRLVLLNAISPIQNTGIKAQRIGAKSDPVDNINILSILCQGAINLLDLFISLKNATLVQHKAI